MFDRLIDGPADHKPVEFGRRAASAAAPALTPPAARVVDHYRKTAQPYGADFQGAARAFTEQLLKTIDPAELVVSLVISLPAMSVEPLIKDVRNHNVQNGYHAILSHGLDRLAKIEVGGWRLSDQQIAAALRSYERVVLANPHAAMQSRVFLAGLMRRAAGGTPELRAQLIAFLDSALQGQHFGATQFRKLVEENLPALAIARKEIPILLRWAGMGRQTQLRREQMIAGAGPLLGPALDHVLDNDADLYRGRSGYCEALQKLFGADALAKGAAFSKLLELIVTPGGYDNLQAFARRHGYFSYEVEPAARSSPPLDKLAIELSKSNMDLSDPDSDHARLIFLLTCREHHHHDNSRLILKQLLKTAEAHPEGKTAQALKTLIEHRNYAAWAADVRDVLRDGARDAGSDSEKRASLPPIAVPDFGTGGFSDLRTLEAHFGNFLEPRLYDSAHSDYLERLAKLHAAIEALPAGDLREAHIMRLIAGSRLKLAQHERGYAVMFIERGSMLHRLRQAFLPLVMGAPEAVQRLASLMHQIQNRPAPAAQWLNDAEAVWDMLPPEKWRDHLRRIIEVSGPYAGLFGTTGEAYLRSILYVATLLRAETAGPMLSDYALKHCYVTRKGAGIASEKLGDACLWSLAELPDAAGVPYLARILARVKYPKIRTKIDAKLNEAAQRAGIGRDELDEVAVPSHGLDRAGTRSIAFGEGRAVIRAKGNGATLEWFNDSGKKLKSPSKAMKDQNQLFTEVQSDLRELNADLAIQPQRLQQFYLQARSWPVALWRARYLDHPLMRVFTLKLVWWIDTADGKSIAMMPDETGETFLEVAGNPVTLDGATVRLWHPMDGPMDGNVETVEAWRGRLEALQVTQPFAQVWREVYALTDAERVTATYTDRWAAHILKQHQTMTLARLNGWRVTHRMWADAPNSEPWHLMIPTHKLVADFWVQGTGGDNPQISGSAAYTYVSTGRVQFHRIAEDAADSAAGPRRGDAVPLTEIPPVVFSEIMRHGDLFTAEASIAADPDWIDSGADAAHPSQWDRQAQDYWRQTNTADLVESGKRRRAILERIVPRLKIAAKLRLEDRTLIVQGTRHHYEIHLGSGACSRGGRHMYIVPKSTAASDKIWLPFEGDRTLSIIISKALLLAADNRITDPAILRQL